MSAKTKADLFAFAFDGVESEYKDLSETWKLLDSKSQATAAIAGVFLAAAFSFVRNTGLQLTFGEKVLLGLLVAVLVISILLAIVSMLVRSVPSHPASSQAAAMVTEALAMPEAEYDDRHAGLLADTINIWVPVNRELQRANGTKAMWLAASQWALIVAAALIAWLTVTALNL